MGRVSSTRHYAIPECRGLRTAGCLTMPLIRRTRGMMLRLARRRTVAVVIGAALALPGLWVELAGHGAPWASGIALLAVATGLALIWSGVAGIKPDWVDDEKRGAGRLNSRTPEDPTSP